jgi:hypothetical protein
LPKTCQTEGVSKIHHCCIILTLGAFVNKFNKIV